MEYEEPSDLYSRHRARRAIATKDLLRNTYVHARDTKAEGRDEYVFIGSAMNVQTVADAESGYTPM
jgi:hypothetical protein